ncbi:MAG: prepilin-type N-terminal cleavage/methylation domain-containing protein [Elusimicrobia bacterium]|nr:prepilin-type N-terminal cleavage/methylation domain-containing protein [Elusimicrobiota bacterium]
MFKNSKRNIISKKGFTFIEVIIVIVIVSILSVAWFFTGKGHVSISMTTEARAFIEKIVAQEKKYRVQKSQFFLTDDRIEESKELMIDSGKNKYFKEFTVTEKNNVLTVTVFPATDIVELTDVVDNIVGEYNLSTGELRYVENFK